MHGHCRYNPDKVLSGTASLITGVTTGDDLISAFRAQFGAAPHVTCDNK